MTNVSMAAAALVSARREGRVLDELPGGMPVNLVEAYAIQDGGLAEMGEAVAEIVDSRVLDSSPRS